MRREIQHVRRWLWCWRRGHVYYPLLETPLERCHYCGKTRPMPPAQSK